MVNKKDDSALILLAGMESKAVVPLSDDQLDELIKYVGIFVEERIEDLRLVTLGFPRQPDLVMAGVSCVDISIELNQSRDRHFGGLCFPMPELTIEFPKPSMFSNPLFYGLNVIAPSPLLEITLDCSFTMTETERVLIDRRNGATRRCLWARYPKLTKAQIRKIIKHQPIGGADGGE